MDQPSRWFRAMVAVAVAVASVPCAATAAPKVAWTAGPAFGGDALIVHGSGLSSGASPSVCWAPRGQPAGPDGSAATCALGRATATAADGTSTVVELPQEMPWNAAVSLKLGPAGRTTVVPLTIPRPWWHLGSSRGNRTAPAGWLRLFGTQLAYGGPRGCAAAHSSPDTDPVAVTLRLVPAGRTSGDAITVKSVNSTCFAAFFRMPPTLRAGTYSATVQNDVDGTDVPLAAAVSVSPPEPWPTATSVEVVAGDSAGLTAALARVGAVGGGVVHLAAGTTSIGPAPLVVPDGVTLQGAGVGATILLLATKSSSQGSVVVGEPGGGRGRLTDLKVTVATAVGTVIEVPAGSWGSEVVRVHVDGTAAAADLPRGNTIGVYGDGATVADCRLEHGGNCTAQQWPHNTAAYASGAAWTYWVRNHAVCLCQSYSFDSPRGLAVMESTWDSSGSNDAEGAGVSSFKRNVAEKVYYRDNIDIGNPLAAKKWESFTSDGPGAAWTGTVGSAQAGASTVPLQAGGLPPFNHWQSFLPGEALVVMKGPATGAVARLDSFDVVAPSAGTVRTSTPLVADVPPGGFGTVMPFRGEMAFEGNTFLNGTTFQFFGAGVDCTVFNNSFRSFGSTSPWGLWYQGGYQPTLRTTWIGNTFIGHSALRTIASKQNCSECNLVMATTFRKNHFLPGGATAPTPISLAGNTDLTVVEGNVLYTDEAPPPWPVINSNATRVVLRNNKNATVTTRDDLH